jgi:NADP-dependent 3-hydroxy acid dehydrogenase YdfG
VDAQRERLRRLGRRRGAQGSPRRRGRRRAPRRSTPTSSTTGWPRRASATGPAFQGLRAAWRAGDEILAEVALDEQAAEQAGRFGLHPGAARRLAARRVPRRRRRRRAAALHLERSALAATGASRLRVRIAPPARARSAWPRPTRRRAGHVGRVARSRVPVDPAQLAGARKRHDTLFELQWTRLDPASRDGHPLRVALLGDDDELAAALDADRHPDLDALAQAIEDAEAPTVVVVDARGGGDGGGLAPAAHAHAARALELCRRWAGSEAFATSRLVFLTSGAVAAGDGEAPALAAAPVWGLVRSAHSEHPDRFGLVDLGAGEASAGALPHALGLLAEEPQLAVRDGELLVPRLARATAEDGEAPALDPERTVLITGGTGGLGALVARHLAEAHGARRLLLVSRRGRDADGAQELERELAELGCEVEIAACDAAERDDLAALLGAIPAEHPLGAVVHAAGVLDDGTLESLDRERLERVLRPKLDAALNLHELTRELELSQFVLFSSAAATFGSPGQSNYAAANAFLDALAHHRRTEGLAASSIAWGLWEQAGGMGGELGDADRARLRRQGVTPLTAEHGLELFDTARARADALLVAVPSRPTPCARPRAPASCRRCSAGSCARPPAAPRRLARGPPRRRRRVRAAGGRARAGALARRGRARPRRRGRRRRGAAVQGPRLRLARAVEFRNRLSQVSGLRLPATLVFDHPTPAAVAEHMHAQVATGGRGRRARPAARQARGVVDLRR